MQMRLIYRFCELYLQRQQFLHANNPVVHHSAQVKVQYGVTTRKGTIDGLSHDQNKDRLVILDITIITFRAQVSNTLFTRQSQRCDTIVFDKVERKSTRLNSSHVSIS